jgi:hypothetical protein
VQELPEAGDDEERIVDPDAEADHRHEDGRDRVHVGQPGEDVEEQEGGREGRERERDRDRRGHERTEHDEQHDDGCQQAERLGRALLDRRELRVTVELGRDAGRLDSFADGVLDCDDGLAVLLEDDAVELRFRVSDSPVVGNRVVLEGVADALDARLVLGRLELIRLELGEGVLDGRPALGCV